MIQAVFYQVSSKYMEKRESPAQRKSLLEAFRPGMEVTVCETTRVDLGPNGAVVFPAGAKLTERAGHMHSPGQEIRQDGYIIVIADSGFEVLLPHAQAQKIMVE